MNTRGHVKYGLSAVYLLMFLATYAVLHVILVDGEEEKEITAVAQELRRLKAHVESQRERLSQVASGIAQMDGHGTFTGSRLPPDLLSTLDLDLIVSATMSGNLLYTNLSHDINEEEVVAGRAAEWAAASGGSRAGSLIISGQIILLAMQSIAVDESGEARMLIIGSLIDVEKLVHFSEEEQISFTFTPPRESIDDILVYEVDEGWMTGVLRIVSLEGDAYMTVSLTRRGYMIANQQFNTFMIYFAVVLSTVGYLVVHVIQTRYVARMSGIAASISRLDPSKALAELPAEDVEEFNVIVDGVNVLLREIERYKGQLAETERLAAIGQLAGMVGHDLRNPLQSLTTTNYLLRRYGGSLGESERREYSRLTENIDNQIWYMDKIVSDIQSIAGQMKPDLRTTSLSDILKVSRANLRIPEKIKVHIEVPDDLPQVTADTRLINRVVSNLMLNAAQAMPEGGDLTVSAEEEGSAIRTSVRDTGRGITEEEMKNLFKLFYTTKAKGTGLGLAASRRIVEAHGGKVEIESKVGTGSTVSFTLPKSGTVNT